MRPAVSWLSLSSDAAPAPWYEWPPFVRYLFALARAALTFVGENERGSTYEEVGLGVCRVGWPCRAAAGARSRGERVRARGVEVHVVRLFGLAGAYIGRTSLVELPNRPPPSRRIPAGAHPGWTYRRRVEQVGYAAAAMSTMPHRTLIHLD